MKIKKNKILGFTLIELLAVIVILAIITLIATPIVLKIIEDSKESVIFRSAEFYIDTVEFSVTQSAIDGKKIQDGTYKIMGNGNICLGEFTDKVCSGEILEVEIKGENVTNGKIVFKDGKVSTAVLTVLGKGIEMKSNKEFIYKLTPGVYDENDNLLVSWDELVTNYDFETLLRTSKYGLKDNAGDVIDSIKGAYKIVLDENIKSIAYGAFANCTSLISIEIPDSVTTIGTYAFVGCSKLKNINLPDTIKSIAGYSFRGCSSLESIKIPSGVTIINKFTFDGCKKLTNIIIPTGVTKIDDNAFYGCKSLTSIEIPNSVINIGNNVFQNCTSLTNIYYSGTATGEPWGGPNATVMAS